MNLSAVRAVWEHRQLLSSHLSVIWMEQCLQTRGRQLPCKKDGSLEHSVQPQKNKCVHLIAFLLLPDWQLLCCQLQITQCCHWQAIEEIGNTFQKTWRNRKHLRQEIGNTFHGEDNTSAWLKGENQILTLLSTLLLRAIPLLNTVRKWQLLHFQGFDNLLIDAEGKLDLQTIRRFSLQERVMSE